MAIFGALGTARSGLVATGAALSVIGNNIANVNTVGFKGSRTDFSDLLSAQGGGGSAGKIGLGTRIGRISASFTQGNIESTGRPTDLAIEGNGFFVVATGDGNLFTRAGNFRLDSDGILVTNQGLPVQGFTLNDLVSVGSWTFINVGQRGGGFTNAQLYGSGAKDLVAREVTNVPEPGTISLLGAGLLVGVFAQRRLRRQVV